MGLKTKSELTKWTQKSSDLVKERRKKLRAHRKGFQDKCEENEAVSYEAGSY